MSGDLRSVLDAVLEDAVTGPQRVPGVAAGVTDRSGNRYEGAAGLRSMDDAAPFTFDTVCAIYSTNKAITSTVVLQLVERGDLELDAPAKAYAPGLDDLQVLTGFADDGSPQLRAPRRDVTTRMLLTHTSGFGYDFFNPQYRRLVKEHGPVTNAQTTLPAVLLFDPGDDWEYGTGYDWAGQVVEGVTGRRLGEVCRERVFEPLGMTDTSFRLTPEMRPRAARIHQREPDGSLRPTDWGPPSTPEIDLGGHGLRSTASDYLKFIRMWLNDGRAPDGSRVLRPETIAMAFADQVPSGISIRPLPGIVPLLSLELEFFPGVPKSWSLIGLVNLADAPTGRSAGSSAWSGLANLYYWIDRRAGIGGFWAAQLFPFADPAALRSYLAFETAAYRCLAS